jgi:hypothetical protein
MTCWPFCSTNIHVETNFLATLIFRRYTTSFSLLRKIIIGRLVYRYSVKWIFIKPTLWPPLLDPQPLEQVHFTKSPSFESKPPRERKLAVFRTKFQSNKNKIRAENILAILLMTSHSIFKLLLKISCNFCPTFLFEQISNFFVRTNFKLFCSNKFQTFLFEQISNFFVWTNFKFRKI